jgi:cyclopropane-fatty-acyl-phospholipid synthase
MATHRFRYRFAAALEKAGIEIDEGRPQDIAIHDDRLFDRVKRDGLVGLGDAYADGWWDCPRLDEFFDRCIRAGLTDRLRYTRPVFIDYIKQLLFNLQLRPAARSNCERHYNLGDDLFRLMLDRRMVYSCAYWQDARDLDQAQEHKLELVCRKLGLKAGGPGQRILDIGCGWGGFARYAAERHGASVVGITVSSDQQRIAQECCRGLPVEIRLQDYRELNEPFDHIASIGMFEHVGQKNHRRYMQVAARCLKPGGLFLLHSFAARRSYPSTHDPEPVWVERNIFPGMLVPSLKQIGAALDGLFVMEDLHNFGTDYDPTLMAWHDNFERNWPLLKDRYDERFHRVWRYYLLHCAAAFRSRKFQLWQMVLSPLGVPGGYRSVRSAVDGAAHAAEPAPLPAAPPHVHVAQDLALWPIAGR